MARLSDKQRAWLDHYLICLNAAEAARVAGYKHPKQMGHENLSKPYLRSEIDRRLNESTMQANEVLYRLGQQAEGLPPECFVVIAPTILSSGGIFVNFERVKEMGLTHLIKKIAYNAKGQCQVELYDGQTALVHLGKHHALFTDKIKHEDWRDTALDYIRSREVTYEALADEFGHDLATELFTLAGVPIQAESS